MKKLKLFGVAAAVVAVTFTVISVINANSIPPMSDLMSKNLEALAQGESSDNDVCLIYCSSSCTLMLDLGNGCLEPVTALDREKSYL